MTITVYAPDSEARPDRASLAASPPTLAGLRVAVLDNGKPNAVTVMARAAETLAARTGAVVSLIVKKGPGGRSANAAIPCADDIFDRLVAEADIVITGAADCGSCTAYSVFDAIALEKHGIPAVVVTTTKFAPIATTMSADFGMPDVRTLVLPHPLGGTNRETLWEWADRAVGRLEALFLGTTPATIDMRDAPRSAGLAEISSALAGLQLLVEADSSRFHLDGVSAEGVVHLTLLIDDASCAECVMPREILEQTATRVLRAAVPTITRVSIVDPREPSTSPT